MRKKFVLPVLTACMLGLMTTTASARGFAGFSSKHFLSENDVDYLFGDLPRYIELGSIPINRMNHIPLPLFRNQCMIVPKKDGTYLKTRAPFSSLQTTIEQIFAECQGDWSVYIKDLKTGEMISINEHPMESASLIKLYIGGAALERIEKGQLEETDTIRNALQEMIVISSNEAANLLVKSFYQNEPEKSFQDGLDIVNDFIMRHGYVNTYQGNGIADPSLWISPGRNNETSTADCGKILEDIYNSELVSHYASYRFENLLNRQEVNYKIPSGLPANTHIGHKTGEVSDTENDAAIIYTPYGDYIFCIMSTDLYDTGSAVSTIRQITGLVHNWFMNPLEILDETEVEALKTTPEQQQSEQQPSTQQEY